MEDTHFDDTHPIFDLIVIGGGINGAGIAADASGRGLTVGLYEANDFASATSSASSKLIHGGLRYLEHYSFRLVAEALKEREILLKKAPHIITPMRFRLPHRPSLRPAWLIRLGLFFYDHLAKRDQLPASDIVTLSPSVFRPSLKQAFEYSDCWVDDARLVWLNILAAKENGADVENYCVVESAITTTDCWHVTVLNKHTGVRTLHRAKALVNATGPWVSDFLDTTCSISSSRYHTRLVQGSHIVVPKLYDHDEAYILQHSDNRIVFVIPYLDDYSMIGTTDREYHGNPADVTITQDEITYLLDVINQHFLRTLTAEDIVWAFSGVRPLCDDDAQSAQSVSRDYTLELTHQPNTPPLLSIFGGKLTTYRTLSESALKHLAPFFPDMGKPWTANHPLPGGQFHGDLTQFTQHLQQQYPWLPAALTQRYAKQFGTYSDHLLAGCQSMHDMGIAFSPVLFQREVDYMITHEYVKHVDDILWRRTKLGLTITATECAKLNDYIRQHRHFHPTTLSQTG